MAEINMAEGYKTSRIREAEGEATQIYLQSNALGNRIKLIGESLSGNSGTNLALKYKLAENYLESIAGLADPSKNVILKKSLDDPEVLFSKAFENFEGNADKSSKKDE
jgi:regulator of protease activity HflC (stomatin/prohibitin superfamily)